MQRNTVQVEFTPMTEAKIPLPRFLKLLTGNNVPVPKAMAVAGKMSVVFIVSRRARLM